MRQEADQATELAQVTHDCAVHRIVWTPDASRVLVAGPVLAPATKPSKTDCVPVQRVNGWLMLAPTWSGPLLVELSKGTVTAP